MIRATNRVENMQKEQKDITVTNGVMRLFHF